MAATRKIYESYDPPNLTFYTNFISLCLKLPFRQLKLIAALFQHIKVLSEIGTISGGNHFYAS